jgi:hypothetical protein
MYEMYWIDLKYEQRDLDQIDQELDCYTRDALMAWDGGLTGWFEEAVGKVNALLIERHACQYPLDAIY